MRKVTAAFAISVLALMLLVALPSTADVRPHDLVSEVMMAPSRNLFVRRSAPIRRQGNSPFASWGFERLSGDFLASSGSAKCDHDNLWRA